VSGRWPEARRLFEALADAPGEEQAAELGRLAARDATLARLVGELLAADRRAAGPLERPIAAPLEALAPDGGDDQEPTRAGEIVGPWRLLAPLGRGGMGEVWAAERAEGQFEQRAAVKLVRRGLDSEEILARFVRERQILAGLSHPNVARLLDGGRAPDGRPYFAMEQVEGQPITEHCAARALSVEARLRLFLAACEAVSAAHQRLIVHRDLKPSNIFVTDDGEVKLLDFGIAKLLDRDDDADLTRAGSRPLTPRYAAPEQLRGAPSTTAADVYSLGAVLYELLTGGTGHRARDASAEEVVLGLEREAVERPSQVVLRGEADDARARRRAARRLEGDLDTIVLAALRVEPERRYPSVDALAEDVRRHLDGRPITARPDSLGYRTAKFVGRHRFGVAAATLAALALVAALALALFQERRAAHAATEAAAAARRAERVTEFLIDLFEVADPDQSGGAEVSASDLVEQAGARLEVELGREPEVLSDLLEAVARIDRSLGRIEPAAALAERAREVRRSVADAGAASLASADATLGAVRMSQGKLEEATTLLASALARLEATEPADSLLVARVRSDRSNVLFWQGRAEEAEREERRVYEAYRAALGPESVATAMHLRNLGVLLEELDRLDEAERAYRESQAVLVRALGPDHANVAQSYLNLAVLLERRDRLDEAESLYRQALDVRRAALSPQHPATAQALQLYGLFLLRRDRLDESEACYREALAIFASINPTSFEVGKCENGLALVASKRGDPATAERLLAEVDAIFRAELGEEHPFTWQARGNRAEQLVLLGRLAEAEALQRQVLERLEALTGAASEATRQAAERLARTLERRGASAGEIVALRARAAPPA